MWRDKNIHVSGGFWLLCAWFGVVNGWSMLGYVLCAASVHELGHFAVLRMVGAPVTGVSIGLFGAEMRTCTQDLGYGQELCCVLAGPGMNLLWAWGLHEVDGVFAGVHLTLCLFNLLPILPLDGGRALSLLLTWWIDPVRGQMVSAGIGCGFAGVMSLGLVWVMVVTGGSLWLAPMAVGFFAVSLGVFTKKDALF